VKPHCNLLNKINSKKGFEVVKHNIISSVILFQASHHKKTAEQSTPPFTEAIINL